MPFTVSDVRDLIRLLADHPEWRAELRPLILGDELLTLPELVRELVEAQGRTEARVEELAQAQARTEARLDGLAQRVEELAQAQTRTEARLDGLLITVRELAQTMERFATEQHRVGDRLGYVDGKWLEQRFYDRAPAYFSTLVRRARVVELPSIGGDEALDAGRLSPDEYEEIVRLDVIVQGEERESREPVLLAVEVSTQIKDEDVKRALRRADLLSRLGTTVIPVVGGEKIAPGVRRAAEAAGVRIRVVPKD